MYKLQKTTRKIFWDTLDKVDVPHWQFMQNDGWFGWSNVESNNIYFRAWNKALIVVDSIENNTYFRMVNDEDNWISYWFVERVSKVLSKGYEVELIMDIWGTYAAQIVRDLVSTDKWEPLIERASLRNEHLEDEQMRNILINASINSDELLDDLKPQYKSTTKLRTWPLGQNNPNIQINYLNRLYPLRVNTEYSPTPWWIWDFGMVFILKNSKTGDYDCFPIISKFLDYKPLIFKPIQFGDAKISNSLQNLQVDYLKTDGAHKDPTTGDIIYASDAFVGVFYCPYYRQNYTTAQIDYRKPDLSPASTFYIKWEHRPNQPILIHAPFKLNWDMNTSLIDKMSDLHDEVEWTKSRDKLLTYFKFIRKQGNNWIIDPMYDMLFTDQFILYPRGILDFAVETDIKTFGGPLPSLSAEYHKARVNAQAAYDTGLSSMFSSTAMSLGTTALLASTGLVSGGLAPLLATGAISAVGSAMTNWNNLSMQKQRALAGTSQTWINSSTSDIHQVIKYMELFQQEVNQVPNTPNVSHLGIRYNLTDGFKKVIKQTYHLWGYPVKSHIPLSKLFNRTTKKVFLKFDETWLLQYLKPMIIQWPQKEVTLETQSAIVERLSRGVRIWKDDVDYFDVVNNNKEID